VAILLEVFLRTRAAAPAVLHHDERLRQIAEEIALGRRHRISTKNRPIQ
jgi:hypothetical protein